MGLGNRVLGDGVGVSVAAGTAAISKDPNADLRIGDERTTFRLQIKAAPPQRLPDTRA